MDVTVDSLQTMYCGTLSHLLRFPLSNKHLPFSAHGIDPVACLTLLSTMLTSKVEALSSHGLSFNSSQESFPASLTNDQDVSNCGASVHHLPLRTTRLCHVSLTIRMPEQGDISTAYEKIGKIPRVLPSSLRALLSTTPTSFRG